jgi:hypothetical protein
MTSVTMIYGKETDDCGVINQGQAAPNVTSPTMCQARLKSPTYTSKGKQPTVLSVALDVYRFADYPELNKCIRDLAIEIEGTECRRKRSPRERKRLTDALRLIVLNLYVAHTTLPEATLGIDLDAKKYQSGSRYEKLFLTHAAVKASVNGLKAIGLIEIVKEGFRDPRSGKGFNTKIRATQALIDRLTKDGKISPTKIGRNDADRDVIELRDADKRLIQFKETSQTKRLRENLEVINKSLDRAWIDIDLSDEQFADLARRMAADPERGLLDVSRNRLVRKFNGDFESGGRFYEGWWQGVPKDYRRLIRLNGKLTTEIDYSGLHPAMLYADAGLEIPEDPYDIFPNQTPQVRAWVKVAFNAMINSETGRTNQPEDYEPNVLGLSKPEFQSRIREAHKPIDHAFQSGAWPRLQYLDSQLAERILLAFAKKELPALPVHDSFIVHHAYAGELEAEMKAAFRDIFGKDIGVKYKSGLIYLPGDTVPEQSQGGGLDDLLEYWKTYSGFHARELAFRDRRTNPVKKDKAIQRG